MISPFEDAVAAASSAIDEVMGEALRLEPKRAAGEFTVAAPDPDRPVLGPILGVVTRHSLIVRQLGAGANSRDHVDLADGRLRVSFDARLFLPGQEPRAGDHVVRLARTGTPAFRLLTGLPVPGRLVYPLLPVAEPS